jgi:lysophospholipase L1-like esterase
VGVGTASPGYALEISKTDSVNNAVTNILALTHLTSGTAAVGMGSGLLFRVANSVYGITVTGASISSNQSNQSVINHPLIFSNTVGNILAERMRLSDQGNLLIGTTTDTSRSLFVSGTSEIDARLYVNKGLVVENTVSKHQVYSIGDSLTYSNGSGYFETQLNTLLGNTWIVVNRGISGQTTAQMLARFQTDIIDRGDAEYITIWGGINDVLGGLSAASIESNLQQMYTMAHNAGLKVVAINISPFKGYSGWTADKQTVLDAVNTWITSSATDVDYVIDIYSVLEDGSNPDALLATYDGGDQLHLSVSGYNQVGSSVYNGSVWTAASAPTNSLFVTGGGTFTGKVGIGTTSPTNKFGVSDGFIDVGGTTGGYKIDNRLILQASSTNQSTLVGYGAGASLLAGGIRNVAVGYQALYVATSTDYNSAIGYRALASNTIGERNTSLGYGVLEFNTTGNYNNAIGLNTLNSNTTGSANNAQGYQALF